MEGLLDPYCGLYMAQTSDKIASRLGISRAEQDEYAVESQCRAAAAWDDGRLAEEVLPVEVKKGKKTELFAKDDHMTPGSTVETLARLTPSFGKDGMVTAGNASGIVDGAAALVVTTEARAREKGIVPLGRLVADAVVGCEPSEMGLGPVPAIRAALSKAGKTLDEMDLVEVNEAFAGQILGVVKELGLDRQKLNVNGGAIALGHPLGATGAILLGTVLDELERTNKSTALITLCIGGGMGIATIIERV